MSNEFIKLDLDDVMVVDTQNFDKLDVAKTMTSNDLIAAVRVNLGSSSKEAILFKEEGMEVKVLRPGDGWKKGKIRVAIAFCPDEPEVTANTVKKETSPLDDLREQVKNMS
jgi:hypothetical protein